MQELEKLKHNLKLAEDKLLNSPAMKLSENLDIYFKAENDLLKYKKVLPGKSPPSLEL